MLADNQKNQALQGINGGVAVNIPNVDSHEGYLNDVHIIDSGGIDLPAAEEPGVVKRVRKL